MGRSGATLLWSSGVRGWASSGLGLRAPIWKKHDVLRESGTAQGGFPLGGTDRRATGGYV